MINWQMINGQEWIEILDFTQLNPNHGVNSVFFSVDPPTVLQVEN